MSEQYPTQAETQEWLNEIWACDPELYAYMTAYEDEEDWDVYIDFGDPIPGIDDMGGLA